MDYRSEAVTLLSNLVAIPSVSTQPAEADLGAFVEQYCQALAWKWSGSTSTTSALTWWPS